MRKSSLALAAASCVLFVAALHPQCPKTVGWAGYFPLFLLFFDQALTTRRLALLAAAVGFAYAAAGLWWLLYYHAWVYGLVVLMIGPTFAIYLVALRGLLRHQAGVTRSVWLCVSLWALADAVYGLSPVGAIGWQTPVYGPGPLLQAAAVLGPSGLGPFVIGAAAACAAFGSRRSRAALGWAAVFLGILAGLFTWGQERRSEPAAVGLHVTVVQHNLPVSGEWRLDHALYIRKRYRDLALQAARERPRLIVFPLYTFPEDISRNPAFFQGLAQETQAHVLVASAIPAQAGQSMIRTGFINTAVLYSPEGKVEGEYRGVQAPPFTEIRQLTEPQYKVLRSGLGSLGILLCYEDSVPRFSREAVRQGADLLIALSNPGFFSSTHLPDHHLLQDRLRAVESGRWLVRASANGYSALIDPRGRLVRRSSLAREELLASSVGLGGPRTFYHRAPHVSLAAAAAVFALCLLAPPKKTTA